MCIRGLFLSEWILSFIPVSVLPIRSQYLYLFNLIISRSRTAGLRLRHGRVVHIILDEKRKHRRVGGSVYIRLDRSIEWINRRLFCSLPKNERCMNTNSLDIRLSGFATRASKAETQRGIINQKWGLESTRSTSSTHVGSRHFDLAHFFKLLSNCSFNWKYFSWSEPR